MDTPTRTARPLDPLNAGTRSEGVAQAVRTAITTGDMVPGQRLLEAELAAQLGTSNGPVREALRQLEAEGLVVKIPYRGAFVAEVSEREIEDVLIPVRLIIEHYAFQCAASMLSEAELAELRAIVERMRQAADSGDDDDIAEQDIAFHELIIQLAAPPQCRQLWRVIQPRVRAYFHRETPSHANRHALVDLHQDLLEALIGDDPDAIGTALETHIRARPAAASPEGRVSDGAPPRRARGKGSRTLTKSRVASSAH